MYFIIIIIIFITLFFTGGRVGEEREVVREQHSLQKINLTLGVTRRFLFHFWK